MFVITYAQIKGVLYTINVYWSDCFGILIYLNLADNFFVELGRYKKLSQTLIYLYLAENFFVKLG
jgi:hypothetical protein